jgi:hypothetical protein
MVYIPEGAGRVKRGVVPVFVVGGESGLPSWCWGGDLPRADLVADEERPDAADRGETAACTFWGRA